MSAEEGALSASARKRANKKARDAAAVVEEAPAPAPAPAPKAKGKAKAEPAPAPAPEPAAKAKGKAKAKAEAAAPAPAPAAAKAEAKAKGKAAAKPAAEPKVVAAAPAAAEPKAKAKAQGKAKGKATKDEDDEPVKVKQENHSHFEVDDGSRAGDWEVSSGLNKKQERRQNILKEREAETAAAMKIGAIAAKGSQYIPGLAPVSVQVAQAKGGAKAKAQPAAAGAKGAAAPAVPAVSDNNVSVTINVPEAKIGRIVGPKGANIILIKEKTGVKTVDMSGEMCTIVGSPDAVALAEHAVRSLIEKGYMALAFDDFEEAGVSLHPSIFPDIIGKKGAVIMVIKKEAKVEVDIPAVPKNAPAGKKYKVTLAGSKDAVKLGTEILNSIAMYGHHPLTHPGETHKEMEIDPWKYSYLIGSKGSEMRHIQNNFTVRVNIPRETSECQNVVIIGEARNVDRAVTYIEKVLYEADQPKGRGAPEASADDGHDDGPVEDWMQAYMYKRK